MENTFLLMVVVLVSWVMAGFAIWKWGPGLRSRSVGCPEKKVRARVRADQREAEFGCLRVFDVKGCSLLPNGQVDCDKACLARM